MIRPTLLRSTLGALALVSPLGACQAAEETAPPPPVRPVLYRVVKPVAAQVFGPFAGVVAPRYQSEIGFQIAGRMIARDVTVGDRVWKTGELVPTGLDVPRGSPFILGIRTFYDRGHLRMGITCALCHTAVDPQSGKVVEGAPNTDLNAGLLMALASNATAYFMHGSADPSAHPGDPARSVTTEDGAKSALPDPDRKSVV